MKINKKTKNNSSNKAKKRKTHPNIKSNSKNKTDNKNCNIIKKEKITNNKKNEKIQRKFSI
jgi:hypothetical protein